MKLVILTLTYFYLTHFGITVVLTVCIDSTTKINNQEVNVTFLLKYSLTREAVGAKIMESVIFVSWLQLTKSLSSSVFNCVLPH